MTVFCVIFLFITYSENKLIKLVLKTLSNNYNILVTPVSISVVCSTRLKDYCVDEIR